jgi:hypothetical protein
MSDSDGYTFSRVSNNYFNGHDLHVVERATGRVVSLNERDGMLAVSVKDRETVHDLPVAARDAYDKIGEPAAQVIYDGLKEDFWRWAEECAERYEFDGVTQAGRSGGWMCVKGSEHLADNLIEPDPDEEGEHDARNRFLACVFEIVGAIEDDWRPQFHDALVSAARDLGAAQDAAAEIRREREPIKVLAMLWINDDGKPTCNLYRNKPALLGAMGTYYEGAATTALAEPGELIAADSGETVAYLTVVE